MMKEVCRRLLKLKAGSVISNDDYEEIVQIYREYEEHDI